MVRKLLGVATAAVLLLGGTSAQAATTCPAPVIHFGTGTNAYDLGVISYQALSSSGVTKVLPELDLSGVNATEGDTLTIVLNNAEFANPDKVVLEVTNGTDTATVSPSTVTSNKLEFTINSGLSGTVTLVALYDDDTNRTLSFKIPGTLKPGDKAVINITTRDQNGQTRDNGCVSQEIMVVKNQFTVASNVELVDDEPLAVTANGVTSLYDDGKEYEGPVTTVRYNPAVMRACSTGGSTTCTPECPTCELVCNSVTSQTSTILGNCVLPATCANVSNVDPNTLEVLGEIPADLAEALAKGEASLDDLNSYQEEANYLQFFQTADFTNGIQNIICDGAIVKVKPILSVATLSESTVNLTLKGNFEGIKSVTFYGANGKELCTATPDVKNGVATCSVSGRQVFDATNKLDDNSVGFTFAITTDGKSQLSPRKFDLSTEITGGELAHPVSLNWGTVMTWGFGRNSTLAFKVPYIRTDNYISSAIRIENAGNAAPVAVFVTDPEGGWKLVKVIDMKAGEEKIITGSTLAEWAKEAGIDLEASKSGRFGVLAVVSMNPCASAGTDGCCHALNFNLYSAQQVIGTDNVRFVPVEVLQQIPTDLH